MPEKKNIWIIPGISFIMWLIVMVGIYRVHYDGNIEEELGYFSSDINMGSDDRNYYNIYHADQKIGYKSEARTIAHGHLIHREDVTLKLSIAGKSREIFTQTSVTIDTLNNVMNYMDFVLHSGSHTYYCSGAVRQDSLIIHVKKNNKDMLRSGYFHIDGNVTVPYALPYIMNNSHENNFQLHIFDPFSFSIQLAQVTYVGIDSISVEDKLVPVKVYDISMEKNLSRFWIDAQGKMIRYNGNVLFAGLFNATYIERTTDRDVFLIPLETGFGDNILDSLRIHLPETISNPRNISYLEVELQGIRAANIDINAPNKEVLSVNPVIFAISRQDVIRNKDYSTPDTSFTASTDYIEPDDARIIRAASRIVKSQTDPLTIALRINSWVYQSLEKEAELHIIRSVDILKELRGGADECTKLFTALARSQGIPVYINMGLVHDGNGFVYHSWPSINYNGSWYDMDPYYGQETIDATHISLVRGDFDQKIELLRLIGDIKLFIRKWQ